MISTDKTDAQSVDSPDADVDRDDEWILLVEGIGKRFSGLQALDDVDTTVNRGKITGLTGLDGMSETALFDCIGGALPPTSGTVRPDGEVISGFPVHKIARAGLVRTFQITCPLEEPTAVESVMIGAHIHTRYWNGAREITMEDLELAGLANKAEEEADRLTADTQKRSELARAVSMQPEILLLDEIMASPIPSKSNQTPDLFRQLRECGTSLLIIEHDMKAIMNISDHVRVLDQGKGIAFGAPETVVEDDCIIEAYIGGFDVDV